MELILLMRSKEEEEGRKPLLFSCYLDLFHNG